MELCPDVIAFAESPGPCPGRWVLMNVQARTCLGVGPEVFTVLEALAPDGAAPAGPVDGGFRIWPIARFSNEDGLLADPSRFRRDAKAWGEPTLVSRAELMAQLERACLVVRDLDAYRQRFRPKQSLVDGHHFGNYHQQLGQHLLTALRRDPQEWWIEQKLLPDRSGIRPDTLYGLVQDRFLDGYLPRRFRAGMRVLDLGCGPGVISRKIARAGADVIGVDPCERFVAAARRLEEPGLRFVHVPLGRPGALDAFADASFDAVFVSDALLFYFVPPDPRAPADIDALIADVRRLLAPAGSFICLEPHPVFYQTPWLGAPDRPFTVLTEYQVTRWRITPSLGRLAAPFLAAGFALVHLDEVAAPPDPDTVVEPRAAAFAREFPLWLLAEFRRA
jgi:SAM-dependent methyltransferase